MSDPIERLMKEFNGQKVANSIIIREGKKNVEAARRTGGVWAVTPHYLEILNKPVVKKAAPKKKARLKTHKATITTKPVSAPEMEKQETDELDALIDAFDAKASN